jgi:hypothetical protein
LAAAQRSSPGPVLALTAPSSQQKREPRRYGQLATVEDRAAAAPDVAGDATDVTISVDGGLIALAANGSKASNWQLRHPLFAM